MRMMLIAAALLAAVPVPAAASPPNAADRQALEALKVAADDAWNAKAHRAMAELYTEMASLRVAPNSPEEVGREAIGRFFEKAFARRPGEFRHVTTIDGMDMLSGNEAVTEGFVRVEQKQADGGWTLARRFRTLSLAVRTRDGWRLRWVRAIPLS